MQTEDFGPFETETTRRYAAGSIAKWFAAEATLADWNLVVETDFRSYWLCAKHAVEHMGAGSVVNVSSNHALATMPGMFPYNAVKSGIDGMTRERACSSAIPRKRYELMTDESLSASDS